MDFWVVVPKLAAHKLTFFLSSFGCKTGCTACRVVKPGQSGEQTPVVLQVSFLWTTVIIFNLIRTVKIGNLYNFGQNINMVISSFTVAELLNLRGVVMSSKLPQQIYLRLKDLGLTTARLTRRGVCEGVHKQRTISTVLNHTSRTIVTAPASRGVVQANLVHIISVPAIPVLITGPEVKKWIKPRSVDHNNLHVVGCHSEAKATSDGAWSRQCISMSGRPTTRQCASTSMWRRKIQTSLPWLRHGYDLAMHPSMPCVHQAIDLSESQERSVEEA